MTRQLSNQTQQQTPTTHPLSSGILQRKCTSCGQHSIGGECGGCQNKQSLSPMPISTSRLAQDFSRVPIRATSVPVIQTKLIVRQPDDKYEQEADRLAAKVVNQINASQPPQSIQRQSILGKLTTADISIMRRKAGEPVDVNQDIEQSIQGSRGKGQPLADDIRGSMEQAFGADFSGVKIHADGKSDQLNHSLSARAFTTGQDIFFKQGEYNPESQQGQELLAHELTHVVQQTGAINRKSTSEQPKTPKVNKGKRESQQTLEVSRASEIIQRREVCDASGVCWSEEGSDESFYSQEPNASYSTDVGTLAEPTQVQEEDPDKPVFDAYKGKNINKIAHVSAPSREYIIAKTSGVNVRAKPDGTLPPIAKVIYDTKVQVLALDNTGAFYYIIANTGAEGWINKNYVVLDPPDVGSHLHHITESDLTTILKNEYVDKGLWTLSTGNDYTTLATAVRVANGGLGGVSVDWEKAQKYKNENWTKRVLDPWMIDNFAIYRGLEIKKGANIWLPSPDYVRMLQSSGQIGSRPGSINTAVDIGNGIRGFSAGIVSGVFGSVWDTLVGVWKLGEGIVTTVKKALDGSLLVSIKSIYDMVMSMISEGFTWDHFKNMVDEVITMGKDAFTNFMDQWNHADKYKMWHFRGYTIGAIALEVVLAIVTVGGTLGLKVLAKIGKYLPELEKILNKLLEVADDLADFRRQRGKGRGNQSQDGDRKDDRNRDQNDENMSNDTASRDDVVDENYSDGNSEKDGKVPKQEGRPRPQHPVEPPRKPDGEIDFNAWGQRLRDKGVRGLPDSELVKKINQARDGDVNSQAELRAAERYADAGYEVEIVRPKAETPKGEAPVIDESLSPDFRVRLPGKPEAARVDVKLREPGRPITKNNLHNRISYANNQLKKSLEGHGDIVIDASQASGDGMKRADIERYLNGEMKGHPSDPNARLSNVDHLEIIYSEGGQLKRSFMLRTVDGEVNGPFTEVIR